MQIRNIHSRLYPFSSGEFGRLIDSLSSSNDQLWPRSMWPPMLFDRPLSVSASGGHGPIRYFVEQYEPGRWVRFRFTGPRGFDGYHEYEVIAAGDGSAELRHTVCMDTHGWALVSWPLVYQPMHDALIEDSLTCVEEELGLPLNVRKWSVRVRFLRWAITRGKAGQQTFTSRNGLSAIAQE